MSKLDRVIKHLSLPVDSMFLAVFRVILGITFIVWAQGYLSPENVTTATGSLTAEPWRELFVKPNLLFKYGGFEWVKLWPGDGIYWHFRITQIAGAALCLGFLSRFAAAMLSLSMTYVLLVERQIYNNHDYLLACTAALMVFLPIASRWSIDRWLGLQRPRRRLPRWHLWLLRFQLGLPYFFGGIAKLNADWLRGQPAELFLIGRGDTPLIGSILAAPQAKWLMAYGGVGFDLLIVPLLLYKRTRVIAILLALVFHLTNATVFTIGVFPWFMLATLYVFFPPDIIGGMISRWFGSGLGQRKSPATKNQSPQIQKGRRSLGLRMALVFVVVQVLLPLRPWLLPGNPSWNERGQRFAWRMMLRHKETLTWFKLETDSEVLFTPSTLVMTPYQSRRAERDPELIRQAAVKAKQMAQQVGQSGCRVYVLSLVSLNGRRAVPIIDPDVDLASVERGWFYDEWVNQDPGPFLSKPWRVPKEQWWIEIELPEQFKPLQNQSLANLEKRFRVFAGMQRSAMQKTTAEKNQSQAEKNVRP